MYQPFEICVIIEYNKHLQRDPLTITINLPNECLLGCDHSIWTNIGQTLVFAVHSKSNEVLLWILVTSDIETVLFLRNVLAETGSSKKLALDKKG